MEVGKRKIANQNYEGACRQRTGHAILRAEKFGDMITADHKVLSEGCESSTVTDMQSWYKIWQVDGWISGISVQNEKFT